jgi:metal-sulfur cluster biosynthetic enzyme
MHIVIFDLKLVYKVIWDEDDNTTLFALVVFEACLSLIFVLWFGVLLQPGL